MALRLFVTATNTGIGKTFTTLHLMEAAARLGLRPGALKPIETGVEGEPADGALLLRALERLNPEAAALGIGGVVPVRYALPAAPFVAKGAEAVDWPSIDEAAARMEEVCDILFVEGAGGLMVPIDETRFMIDLPARFGVRDTLLVAPGRLGSINDTLLSLEALARRGLPHTLAVNLHGDAEDFDRITRPYYDAVGLDYHLFPKGCEAYLRKLF
ncbi:dethiobiotin synthase [Hydrogenimonas sp.]